MKPPRPAEEIIEELEALLWKAFESATGQARRVMKRAGELVKELKVTMKEAK